MTKFTLVCILAILTFTASAATMVCEGVLGNSGEQGPTLVRFSDKKAPGMGVVFDKYGSLWDRGGAGVLNRYAPDGRLLAQFKIPSGNDGMLTLVGDALLILQGQRLYSLSIEASPGSEAKDLKVEAQSMSFGSASGEVALNSKGKISLFNASKNSTRDVCELKDCQNVELTPDGTLYAQVGNKIYKIVDGKPVGGDGWPRGAPGERFQFVNGSFYGHAWHGTMRRFSADLEPAPGVVLGGSSGSFIGHLDQNSELSNGRGLAHLRDHLYAISGMTATLHLLEWQPLRTQMEIIRRIGATPRCEALAIDRSGRVWWHHGAWHWDDAPDTPIRYGVNAPEDVAQAVMLDNDTMVAPGTMWGKPSFWSGPLHTEVKVARIEKDCVMPKGMVAAAAFRNGNARGLLILDSNGKGETYSIGDDGRFNKDLGPSTVKAATPIKTCTSLATRNGSSLMLAADGTIIELSAEGNDWKEMRRWNSWGIGADEKFGAEIFITADTGRLVVSDTQRHRVLVFDFATNKPVASFGNLDKSGDDLKSLTQPRMSAIRGDRVVVHDAGNQRLVKLVLK